LWGFSPGSSVVSTAVSRCRCSGDRCSTFHLPPPTPKTKPSLRCKLSPQIVALAPPPCPMLIPSYLDSAKCHKTEADAYRLSQAIHVGSVMPIHGSHAFSLRLFSVKPVSYAYSLSLTCSPLNPGGTNFARCKRNLTVIKTATLEDAIGNMTDIDLGSSATGLSIHIGAFAAALVLSLFAL